MNIERPNIKISQYIIDEFNQKKNLTLMKQQQQQQQQLNKQQELLSSSLLNNAADTTSSKLALLLGGSILGIFYVLGIYKMFEHQKTFSFPM
jgi:molecular chaperone DnaK (HSP70)